jgi:hypothetical protein
MLLQKKESRFRFQLVRGILVAALACSCLSFYTAGMASEPSAKTGDPEEQAVFTVAKKYLDAEVVRDLPAVYAFLAPSSAYCAAHDYEAFVAEANASPVRIIEYKILRVAHIMKNDDLKNFPRVEKFAYVEVDVVVFYKDTNQKADVNIGFTFIKERGKWYKG